MTAHSTLLSEVGSVGYAIMSCTAVTSLHTLLRWHPTAVTPSAMSAMTSAMSCHSRCHVIADFMADRWSWSQDCAAGRCRVQKQPTFRCWTACGKQPVSMKRMFGFSWHSRKTSISPMQLFYLVIPAAHHEKRQQLQCSKCNSSALQLLTWTMASTYSHGSSLLMMS